MTVPATIRPAKLAPAARGSLSVFAMLAAERVAVMAVGLFVVRSVAHSQSLESFAAWQIAYSAWVVMVGVSGITGERVMLPRLMWARNEGTDPIQLLRTMLAAKIVSGLGAGALLVVWGASYGQPAILVLAAIWAVQVALVEPAFLAVHAAYARQDFIAPPVARLTGLATRALVAALVYAADGPLYLYAAAWVVEIVVTGTVLWRRWNTRPPLFGSIDLPEMKRLFSKGAALGVAAASAAAISRIDRIAFGAVVPTEVVAQVSAAMSLVEAAYGLSAILATVAGAKLLFRPDPIAWHMHLRTIAFAAAVALAIGATLWVFSAPLIALVFGDKFADTSRYLGYAIWLLPAVFVQAILQAPLLARASNRYHLVKAVVSLALGIGATGLVVALHRYDQVLIGAFFGYAALIVFDSLELSRRRNEIYLDPRHA